MEKYFSKRTNPNQVPNQGENNENVVEADNVQNCDRIGFVEASRKRARVESQSSNNDIIVDPALRIPIHEYPPEARDEVRRKYVLHGPCQPLNHAFPTRRIGSTNRKFQSNWFALHPWLEYSVSADAVFCFWCYLFRGDKGRKYGDEVFTVKGFINWKNATRSFKEHEGKVGSAHHDAQTQYLAYKDQRQSILHNMSTAKAKSDSSYRIRLTTSLDVIRLCLEIGITFRGHDESEDSTYKGNFLNILKWYGMRCPDVEKEVLTNAPKNNQLTSPDIQHDLIGACAGETRAAIIKDIGGRVFSILFDEARDCSVKEQMAFVLRYLNNVGEVQESFIGLVHVSDTSAATLKNAVDTFLTQHGLSISNVRGQGYDGASNMRGELNGLKTLIQNENPSAWYIHCFAHQLQLVVVTVAGELKCVHQFFTYVSMAVNLVGASCKRKDQLRQLQHEQMVQRIEENELYTGKGLNQEKSLSRPGSTRWGSHYKTIVRLLHMWTPVLEVLTNVYHDGTDIEQSSTVYGLVEVMERYEFIFIAHLMVELLGITNDLSSLLQRKDQDILAAVGLIGTTKAQLQRLREAGFEELTEEVNKFCVSAEIPIPNMEERLSGRLRGTEPPTFAHYFRVDIFYQVIDRVIAEMNNRFTESSSELLECISCLDPRNNFSRFDVSKLLRLAELYPLDFSPTDRVDLKFQLRNYITEMRRNENFANICDIGGLARKMIQLDIHRIFQLVFRLIELALVLPVATATVERAFSSMKIIKTDLRNKMGDDLLNDCMICYVERDVFSKIDNEVILNHFQNMKTRRHLLPPKQ